MRVSHACRVVTATVMCTVVAGLALMPTPVHAASSAYISSRPVLQQHALDCEAAALQIALSAIGVNTTQDTLLGSIGDDPRPPTMQNGHPVQWGNPYSSFVGQVDGAMLRTGYGVYYPPIAAAAQAAGAIATGAEGWQPSQLYAAVASGDPVVVWVPHLLAAPSFGAWTAWDGTAVWYSSEEHTQVLVGFDDGAGTVTLADPWDARLHTVSMSLFETRLQQFHDMAVVVAPPDGPAAVVTSNSGHQALFWKGTDNNLWEAWNNGTGWTGAVEVSDAAPLASAPSVAVTDSGQQIVFWQGTDGLLHEMWWDPGSGWNGPVLVNGHVPLASRPSVMVTAGNQVLFWESLGGQLQETWWNWSSGWNGPVDVPGDSSMSSAPTAIVAPNGDRTDQAVFWKGSDATLHEEWWDPVTDWNGPVQVPGALPMGSGPAAVLTPANQQVVLWTGVDKTLRKASWYGDWSGESSYSFATFSSAPSFDITASGQQVVWWKGDDANAWTAHWASGWSAPTDLHIGPIA